MNRKLHCIVTVCLFIVIIYLVWNKKESHDSISGKREGSHDVKNFAISNQTKPAHEVYDGVRTFLLFIGYSRSGHTLVGSLLDAHPHVIVANELEVIGRWQEWERSDRNKYFLFDQLFMNSKKQANTAGSGIRSLPAKHRYSYAVPGQWQGKYKDNILVIGDKHGPTTTYKLMRKETMEILREIQTAINLPIKFLHVVRNPYDNIATMMLREMKLLNTATKEQKANEPEGLDKQILKYFGLAEKNSVLMKRFAGDVLEIHSSHVVKQPKEVLIEICQFLQLTCDEQYLEGCSKTIFNSASKTRDKVVWTDAQIKEVKLKMENISFLKDYSFED